MATPLERLLAKLPNAKKAGKGWSARFLVMGGKPKTRPLDGAEILLDGEFVGKTRSPNGTLNVYA